MALQSSSEGTSSEPRDDHTDASSVEVTSRRPRRAVTLRRAVSLGNAAGSQEVAGDRRRTTRSLSAYNQNNKYQPPKGQDVQVRQRHVQYWVSLVLVLLRRSVCVNVCVFQVEEEDGQLVLDRNPLEWSVDEVVQFINSTDCASLANIFQEQVHTHTHTPACVQTLKTLFKHLCFFLSRTLMVRRCYC